MPYWKIIHEVGKNVERDQGRAGFEGRLPRGSLDPEISRALGESLFSGVDEFGFDDGLSPEAIAHIKEITRGIEMPEGWHAGRERK